MSYCSASRRGGYPDPAPCPRPESLVGGNLAHFFSLYDGFNQYHPECCPRTEEGMDCDDPHPDDGEGLA